MEKLLCTQDIMSIFGCKRDKALELMREMNPIDLNRKPGSKRANLRVWESDVKAWLAINCGREKEQPKHTARRGRKPRPVVYIMPDQSGQIPHRIPRRKPEKSGQAKSPGDVAASTGAREKVRTQYTTTAREAQG